MQGCSRAMLSQQAIAGQGKGLQRGDVPALPSLHSQPGSALGSRRREAAPSASLTLLQGWWGERTKPKEIKDGTRCLCKTSLSLWSRWAGAQAGSEVAESHLGKISVPAVPRQAAPQGSSAQPRTCIAELFVEPILQVQLGGPGFYGFLGREKGDQLNRKFRGLGADTSLTCWQQLD